MLQLKRLPTSFLWPFSVTKLTAMVDVVVDRSTILCPDMLTYKDKLLIYNKQDIKQDFVHQVGYLLGLVHLFVRFAGESYGRFIAVHCKFKLSTFVQEPLMIRRRGRVQRYLNEETVSSR